MDTLYPEAGSSYGPAYKKNVVIRDNELSNLAAQMTRTIHDPSIRKGAQPKHSGHDTCLQDLQSTDEISPTTTSSFPDKGVSTLRPKDKEAKRKEEHKKTESKRRKEESKLREKIAKLLPGIFLVNAEPGNRKKGAANYTKIGVLDGVIMFIESLPVYARVKAEEGMRRKVEEIRKKDLRYFSTERDQ